MPRLFDFHAGSGQLALWRQAPDGQRWIELRTLEGRALGSISSRYLPYGFQWSPDGSTLAFGSNDGRLYLFRPGDDNPQLLFEDPSLQGNFWEWSADGKGLFFSAYDRIQGTPPNVYALTLESGQAHPLTNDPGCVDRFPHGSPSGQWVAFRRQSPDEPEVPSRVYVTDVQSGNCFPALSWPEADYEMGRFGWSPDSSSLLVRVTHPDRVEARVVRLEDRGTLWRYESATLEGAVFSPQGERILGIGSDELLWFAYPEGTLLERLPLETFSPVRFFYTGAQVAFDASATTVYFLGADANLYRWNIGGDCECVVAAGSQAKPAFSHETYAVPSRDGRTVPVQRFIPPEARSPAILYVHGGPNGAIDPNDPFMLRLLAEGIEFVCAAYRGSSGYGPEHEEANRGECGRADVWDILAAGFDWKVRAGDERPLVVAGYSYGGFLMFLALAQEAHPWAGGIGMWSVSGLHRMGLLQHRAFPTDGDERARARIERSPLEKATRIRVPLLIFHGALDTTATTEEMRAIQKSVTSRGGECELVVYEDDTHGLMRHRDEIHAAVLRFLERFE